MRKLISHLLSSLAAAALAAALASAARAQDQSTTRIVPVPDGAIYMVDGAQYQHAASFIWPKGSKHQLQAPNLSFPFYNTQYVFQGWAWSGGSIPGNLVYVTADPSITQYTANFAVQFGVNLVFNSCSSVQCPSPGTVTANGTNYTSDQLIYVGAGSAVTFQAQPNPGYVFIGWSAGTAQVVTGFQNVVTVNAPITVQAKFAPARPINFTTVPDGLTILADRSPVPTPNEIDWGMGTTHTLGVISPQLDNHGKYWVFASWSDGGAVNHAYTVATSPMPDTVTATFNPGVTVQFITDPQGLNLNIDGRANWPSYLFTWGIGETHTVQAPNTQTDGQNRLFQFSKWSDGSSGTVRTITVPSDSDSIANGVRLVVSYTQMGHAVVDSAIAGVSLLVDGNGCAAPCDIVRPLGTQVHISAPPSIPGAPGSRQDFAGWSNGARGDLALTLGSDFVSVTATYKTMNYLAATSNPANAVNFSLQPSSPDGYYDSQTRVSVAANALPGFRFRSWNGDLTGSTPSGTVSMDSPRAVQAIVDRVPYVAPSGITNAAGATPAGAVAPGSVVSIFGANLAADTFLGQGSPMPQALGGVTVRVGDRLLPLYFVSPAQINVQMPTDLPPGPQTLTVSGQGQPDVQSSFAAAQDAPGLFPQTIGDQTFATAVHADGSPVTPASPAAPGETITVYGTGFGATTPNRPAGLAVPSAPTFLLVDSPSIQIGGVTVAPSNAFALSGAVGVDAVQFVVSDGLPTGTNAQLTITVNGQASNTVLLPMQ